MDKTADAGGNSSRWDKMRELFDEASMLEPEARESWLRHLTDDAEVRESVRRLLLAHERFERSEGLFGEERMREQLEQAVRRLDHDADAPVGGFHLGRLLGEGGMGRVYHATRTIGGTVQQVALKIVPFALHGERAVERLRHEHRILAGLDHPNIARLIDAGELPDDRPWFAMEYVDGTPITRHCAEHALDLRARLALFLDVCEAVAYAHRQLVLHRDLKPGNILVDRQGRVRLVDFGIGKSLVGQAPGNQTTIGSSFFSLYSAAPEQLLGRATSVGTDVYGLGCVLYELLAGRTAFVFDERPREEIVRAILSEPPQPMSETARNPALHGDLDAVVSRALRKDPADRYRSVDEFAADVRNVLEFRPIASRSSERWYRARMFVRRHRATVVIAAVLGLAVLATTAISIVQSQRASAERDRAVAALAHAQLQRDHARRVTDFLTNAFKSIEPTQGPNGVLRVDDLFAAATRLLDEGAAADDPLLRATIAQTLTHFFFLLDRREDSTRQARIAAEAMAQIPDPTIETHASQQLADAEAAFGEHRYADARKLSSAGLQRLGDNVENGELLFNLWQLRLRATRAVEPNVDATFRLFDEAIALLSPRKDISPERKDWLRYNLATIQSGMTSWQHDAIAGLLSLIEEQNARPRVGDASRIETLRVLGRAYMRMGKFAESAPILEEAYRLQVERFGEDHSRTRLVLDSLAGLYSNIGRNDESMMLYRKLVEISRRQLGERSDGVTFTYYNLGSNYYLDYHDARLGEYFLSRALATCPPDSVTNLAFEHRQLGEVMLVLGRYDAEHHALEANRLLAQAANGKEQHHFAMINLAYLYFRKYRFDDARALLTPAVIADVRNANPAFANNFRELKREVDEMAAFYGM